MTKLKPCPFCGASVKTHISSTEWYHIKCGSDPGPSCCHMATVNTPEAIQLLEDKWNTRPAAVQWVTYTGEPETLPFVGATVLFDAGEDGTIVVYYRSHPVEGRTWCHYELGAGDFEVAVGDRWAYLPTPGGE